jgi:hypothetical protein
VVCPEADRSAPSGRGFCKVAISDMFEVQSSQLALAKQADADTEKMIQDHQRLPAN